VIIASISHYVLTTIYNRILSKKTYRGQYFSEVIENRGGTIGVTPEGIVFGDGLYDGRFNTDLLDNITGFVRTDNLAIKHGTLSTSVEWKREIQRCK